MELCADFVSFITLKAKVEKELSERLLKLIRILEQRSQKRIKIFDLEEAPENCFSTLLKNEESSLIGKIRNAEKYHQVAADICQFAGRKEEIFEKDLELIEYINETQKSLVDTLIKTDKTATQLERKNNGKTNQNLDIDISGNISQFFILKT